MKTLAELEKRVAELERRIHELEKENNVADTLRDIHNNANVRRDLANILSD